MRIYNYALGKKKSKINKKSIAVNKLGSIFHISLKNLSGYIQVSKHRVCCLEFGGAYDR